METLPILLENVLFSGIDASDIPHLLSCLQPREASFHKDQIIISEGDEIEDLGIVLSGSVHIVRHDFWGNRTLVSTINAGEVFAETMACAHQRSEVSVVSCEETSILFLAVRTIITTCRRGCVFHHIIIENMIKLLSQKNLGLMKKMNHITKRSTKEKLLSFLSEEARKAGERTFTIPYDRQQLADYLCVERSAMSNELSKMKAQGLLNYSRNTFQLKEDQ